MLRHHGLFDFSGNILYKTNKHRFLRFFFYIINHGIHFFTPDSKDTRENILILSEKKKIKIIH